LPAKAVGSRQERNDDNEQQKSVDGIVFALMLALTPRVLKEQRAIFHLDSLRAKKD